jgi:hypothetical protein
MYDDDDARHIDATDPAIADITIDEFILDGRPMDADVRRALLNVSLDRHIDGASAIIATLTDADYKLLNAPLFAKTVELNIRGLPFVLCDIDITDDGGSPGLRLEFEPRAINKAASPDRRDARLAQRQDARGVHQGAV